MSLRQLLALLLSALLVSQTDGCAALSDLGGSGISFGWYAYDPILDCSGGSTYCAIGSPSASTWLSFGRRKRAAMDSMEE